MTKITITNNLKRSTVIVDENTTVRQILADNDVDYSAGANQYNSRPLTASDLDKTLAELGVTSNPILSHVAKQDNAQA